MGLYEFIIVGLRFSDFFFWLFLEWGTERRVLTGFCINIRRTLWFYTFGLGIATGLGRGFCFIVIKKRIL